jgi:hypothetical protein
MNRNLDARATGITSPEYADLSRDRIEAAWTL